MEASDGIDVIGTGTHSRAVVPITKFIAAAEAKIEQASKL